jgi:excisionase family DNA binding protein
MTSEQAAELLGHSPVQIRIWAKEGTLPARRRPNGRQYLFDRDEVISSIRQHRVVPED